MRLLRGCAHALDPLLACVGISSAQAGRCVTLVDRRLIQQRLVLQPSSGLMLTPALPGSAQIAICLQRGKLRRFEHPAAVASQKWGVPHL